MQIRVLLFALRIFSTLASPIIPLVAPRQTIFSIVEYGAVNDNHTINTASIQRAIDAASAAGGGLVLAPPGGAYKTGALSLRSNVFLFLPSGSTILGSSNSDDYTSISGGNWDRWDVLHSSCVNCGLVGDEGATGTLQGPMWQMIDSFDPDEVKFLVNCSAHVLTVSDIAFLAIDTESTSTGALDEHIGLHRRMPASPAGL